MSLLPIIADAAQAQSGPLSLLVPVLLFAGMWFLMIAPQRKRQKQHDAMLKTLAAGDEVMVAGGIYGCIANVKEDRFVVKISDTVKIEVAKASVQARLSAKA